MKIDSLLCDNYQTKIRVIAGDVPEGTWNLVGSLLAHAQKSGAAAGESINVAKSVQSMSVKDLVNKDSFEPLLGAGIGALLGFRIFGPLGAAGGAIAGSVLTRNRLEVSVRFELTDGRKFIAVMHPKMYEQLKTVATKSHEYASK